MNLTQKNPFIGPRTFQRNEGHLFFGREREASDLIALVSTRQLVLFYAQSGAGKSSIVNTRLIPGLEKKNYEVLPVSRVSGDVPTGNDVDNIYIYNLIHGLVQHKADPGLLAKLSLVQFLAGLNVDANGYFYDPMPLEESLEVPDEGFTHVRRALIIDQFEELLSTHPEAWEKREDFFIQLAQAMQADPYLWVVLVMREDYIAMLDPYAHHLSGGLRVRYYMERLGREAALTAVKSPVAESRPFAPGVAEKLVEDLSSIKVQLPDQTTVLQPGQYIEPVQLQVVCYGLWENLPKDGTQITEKDLLEVGDVDEALGKYFAGRIAGVAKTKDVKERMIREWIEKKLIAPGGIRNVVLQDTSRKNTGISDEVIQALQSDLVRAEKRGGATWYELTHDRLVGPILENNKKWFDENLSPLQRQATLWNDQERNENWLLRDQALAEVEKWAGEHQDELTKLETEFLGACQDQQAQFKLEEQANSARRAKKFTVVSLTLTMIAIIAAAYAFLQSNQASIAKDAAESARATALGNAYAASTAQVEAVLAQNTAQASEAEALVQKQKAEEAADQALAGNLAAQADSLKISNYRLALLLGLEAYKRDNSLLTRTTLLQLLESTPYTRKFDFDGTLSKVSNVAVSPDGSIIAVAICSAYNDKRQCTRGGVNLYNTALDENKVWRINSENPESELGAVYTLAFHKYNDMLVLAIGGCIPSGCSSNNGQISLWEIAPASDQNPKKLFSTLDNPNSKMHSGLVKTIAFSPDGNLLASGSNDTKIILWDVSDPRKPEIKGKIARHTSFVNTVAFAPDPDNKTLVSASDDTTIRLWDVSNPESPTPLGNPLVNHKAPVNSIAFSPDGVTFASSSNDSLVILWKWDSNLRTLVVQKILKGHTGYITSIAFSPDGKLLASAGFDNSIIIWNTEQAEQVGPPLIIHSDAINSLAFGNAKDSSTGLYLISGSDDRTLIKWDLAARKPISRSFEPETPYTGQKLMAVNDKYIANVSGQQIGVKKLVSDDSFLVISGFNKPVNYVEFIADKLLTIDQYQVSYNWITEWTIDPNVWVTFACDAVARNLTQPEWDKYLPNQPYRKTCESYP